MEGYMTKDEAYKTWWHNEGSGILPLPNEDMEEFAHRMTQIAWSNGVFIEREACAKLLERTDLGGLKSDVWLQNYTATILDGYAKAIRARGQAC
jgi:hypothetical protein